MSIAQQTRIQAYQLKAGGSRARMAILRMVAADSVNNFNESTRLAPGDWRGARQWTLSGYESAFCNGLGQGFDGGKTPIWSTFYADYFRNERDASELARSRCDYAGWYTDRDQSETAIGIVGCLPHGRFIAGYRWTSNGERVWFSGVYDCEYEAARMGDQHARVFAESAREDSERFSAMQEAKDEVTLICQRLGKYLPARNVTVTLREEVRSMISELKEARETLAEKTAAYERG